MFFYFDAAGLMSPLTVFDPIHALTLIPPPLPSWSPSLSALAGATGAATGLLA
jgi:hypothetical protein